MSGSYDAIVIGAGVNGLTAALTLAAAGRRVLVLERAAEIGGLAAPREFAPGFRVPGLLPDTATFRPELIAELGLEAHGLRLRDEEAAVFVPFPGGARLLHADPQRANHELAALSPEDGAAYAEWRHFLDTISPFIRRLLDRPPPKLDLSASAELRDLALTGWSLRRLGRQATTEVMRVMPMCVADWLSERFRSESLAATLAAPALIGSYNGPWAAGSAANLIFRECSAARSTQGGAAALVDALTSACRDKEIEIRTASQVERIVVESGRTTGVRLASGDAIEASTIVATGNPKVTMLDLVGARYLDAGTERDLHNYRCRGTTAILLLAVDGAVEVAERPGETIERLRLGAGSFNELERAFDAVKYGEVSSTPYLEIWIPSFENPSLAPEGGHVVAAIVSCAPYALRDGWTMPTREATIQAAVHRINEHIPGLRDRLTGGSLLAPADLEEQLALPGGHLLHGEPALDQLLFLRPSLHLSRYATPVDGLFLGGSGNHPGGGITGMPGRLAALAASRGH